ncbi:MAG: ATP-binding protein [Quisquiliibacterium sp.]
MLADNQTDFVQLFEADGTVLYESPSMIQRRGFAALGNLVDRIAQSRSLINHPDDREEALRTFRELVQTAAENVRYTFRHVLPSGEISWFEALARAITDAQGKTEKVLVVSRDITERKLAENALLEARQQADEANAAKSQFLARVSHELRTPLNAVLGYGYLLERSQLNQEQSEQIGQINASSRYLLGLISDVLDLSKIEAGELELAPSDFSLHMVLKNVLDQVRADADPKGLALVLDAPDIPDAVHGDAQMLQQMLLNYLSNAVKFTERGQITLRVRVEPEQVLHFEVQDTGAGIAPDKLSELFQPFHQLQTDKRGTGLGLEITRRMAELMGGEVGVRSELGAGSTFWFSVPLQWQEQQAQAQAQAQDVSEQLRARFAGTQILVADDDLINQALMRALLNRVGLEVDIAEDGVRAVELATAQHYPMVLMDLQMPNMGGMQATREIRKLAGWEQIPIIALTADVFAETRQACFEAGMTDFLTKPLDADRLYLKMLGLLSAPLAAD